MPGTESSPELDHVGTLISDFNPPELLFKLPSKELNPIEKKNNIYLSVNRKVYVHVMNFFNTPQYQHLSQSAFANK